MGPTKKPPTANKRPRHKCRDGHEPLVPHAPFLVARPSRPLAHSERIVAFGDCGAIRAYSFQYVGETAKCYITSVCSTSGSASGQLRYGDDIYATGTNLYFNAEDGDTIVLTRADGTTVNMSCGAWSALVLNIPWAEGIKETDIGTDVTLTFTLHGGDKTLTPKVITKKVKLLAAE